MPQQWSLVEYRKEQAARTFVLADDLTVIKTSPSNEDELKNSMRQHRSERMGNQINKMLDEAAEMAKDGKPDEEVEAKYKEVQKVNAEGMDLLVETCRTMVLDDDGKRVPFAKLRKCFKHQDEIVAFMAALNRSAQDPTSGATNGSESTPS